MIYDANFLAAFRKRRAPAPKAEKTEMDFSRYADQLRPWTHRDAAAAMAVETELARDLDRAQAKEEETQDDHGARPH